MNGSFHFVGAVILLTDMLLTAAAAAYYTAPGKEVITIGGGVCVLSGEWRVVSVVAAIVKLLIFLVLFGVFFIFV
jgi:hypothetical protein